MRLPAMRQCCGWHSLVYTRGRANLAPGSEGAESYTNKQREYEESCAWPRMRHS